MSDGTIGTGTEPIDLYLNAEGKISSLLAPGVMAYADTVELETADGTLVFESDSPIEVRFKEDE